MSIVKTNAMAELHKDIIAYNNQQDVADREICVALAKAIEKAIPEAENKVWHGHPVWFINENPVVGYSKLKGNVRLLFWSGQSFDEPGLRAEGKFKAAEAAFTAVEQINQKDLERWLSKARSIQWDYKNIVKRKGRLERLV